jgi:hypothetical protein
MRARLFAENGLGADSTIENRAGGSRKEKSCGRFRRELQHLCRRRKSIPANEKAIDSRTNYGPRQLLARALLYPLVNARRTLGSKGAENEQAQESPKHSRVKPPRDKGESHAKD